MNQCGLPLQLATVSNAAMPMQHATLCDAALPRQHATLPVQLCQCHMPLCLCSAAIATGISVIAVVPTSPPTLTSTTAFTPPLVTLQPSIVCMCPPQHTTGATQWGLNPQIATEFTRHIEPAGHPVYQGRASLEHCPRQIPRWPHNQLATRCTKAEPRLHTSKGEALLFARKRMPGWQHHTLGETTHWPHRLQASRDPPHGPDDVKAVALPEVGWNQGTNPVD